MNELDVVTQEQLVAVTDRRRQALAGALDALALARSNAARSEHALEVAAAAASPDVASAGEGEPATGGWDRRADTTEIVVGEPDGEDAGPSSLVRPVSPPRSTPGDEELEGRDWLR